MISAIDQCLDGHWGQVLITLGLLLDAAGAFLLASILFVSKGEASARAATKWNQNEFALSALLRDSKCGKWGAGLLVSGFFMQIIGLWL